MVGFVMIVVLVAIVSVIFLGISFRSGSEESARDSSEIHQFLDSMMEYTTECALRYEPAYSQLNELIKECDENSATMCINGQEVCDVAEEDIGMILGASFVVGEEAKIKGYTFNSAYTSGEIKNEIFNISEGSCENSYDGAENVISALPGVITSSLKICS